MNRDILILRMIVKFKKFWDITLKFFLPSIFFGFMEKKEKNFF